MPITNTARPQFYEEQYLGAEDLNAAVEYGRQQQARHALGAHVWGIAMGLELVEKLAPGGAGQMDVFVQPGYAWDGYGRPIVLLSPARLAAELFSSLTHEATDEPNGRAVQVWVRYDEAQSQAPRAGFAGCNGDGSFARVQETFRFEIGFRQLDEQHDKIFSAGREIDPKVANPPNTIYDESIPFQELPAPGERRRWLIPLGSVQWKPNPNPALPGNFVQRDAAALAASVRQRRYIGVVAGSVEAAGKTIRLHDRAKDYSTTFSDDLVWVEGNLRIDQDARLFGGQLEFRNPAGQDLELRLRHRGNDPNNPRALQVAIGPANQQTNQFAVGTLQPLAAGEQALDPKFVVMSGGNVGIGTAAPATQLHVVGNRIRLENAGKRLDLRTDGSAVDLHSETDSLYLRSSGPGGKNNVIINQAPTDGNVGIGTETPSNKLHVAAATGIRQNRLYLTGGDGWSSLAYNAFHNAGNSAWVFPDPARKAITIEMDDFGGATRCEIFSNLAADPNAWQSRFKIFGDTGQVAMGYNGGNVGIGAISPQAKLQVTGGAIMPALSANATDANAGIQFPSNPGGGGGDEAFIRYFVQAGETTKLLIGINNDADDTLGFHQFGAERMTIRSGMVGIGTQTPIDPLHVIGDIRVIGAARKSFPQAWASTSDLRLKTKIAPLKTALGRLLQLRGVQFEWKEPGKMGNPPGPQIGLIAQEVEPVFPEWVGKAPDGYLELTITGFEALAIEALRELQTEIETLKARLEKSPDAPTNTAARPRKPGGGKGGKR